MPLIDQSPQRVLAPREQDQINAERQAALTGTLLAPLAQQAKLQQSSSPNLNIFSDLLKGLTGPSLTTTVPSLDTLLTPTPKADTTPAATPNSGGIIGKKNYLTGHGAPALRATAQTIAAQQGWDQGQFNAWDAIINAESGWNPNAQNPTSSAFGLGQFLNSTWKGYGAKTSDPTQQLTYMANYIKSRYGSPQAALAFHAAHNYY